MREVWRLEECGTEDIRGRGLPPLIGKRRSPHSRQLLYMWHFLSFHQWKVEGKKALSPWIEDSGCAWLCRDSGVSQSLLEGWEGWALESLQMQALAAQPALTELTSRWRCPPLHRAGNCENPEAESPTQLYVSLEVERFLDCQSLSVLKGGKPQKTEMH